MQQIAISANGGSLEDQVGPRFGRASSILQRLR
jgi:predicted Fe-Mo cluster-binding NifX family protein